MQVINKTLVKVIVFVVALQILNMSIDIPVAQKDDTGAQDYNYIDTYIEYVTEVVLKHENAIPETKHRQHRHFQLHKNLQIICQPVQSDVSALLSGEPGIRIYQVYLNPFSCQFVKEIHPPPPKYS